MSGGMGEGDRFQTKCSALKTKKVNFNNEKKVCNL